MKTCAFLLLLATWLATRTVIAQPAFNVEQYGTFDGVLGTTLAGLKEDPANLDSLLKALDDAFANSGYGRDASAGRVRQTLVAEAAQLKEAIAKVEDDLSTQRAKNNVPAVMVGLLSREQALCFEVYKWCRTITELTDLANASARRADPAASQLSALMIREGEAQQDTLSTAIQVIAAKVLTPPAAIHD